jgi:hypothetical protein
MSGEKGGGWMVRGGMCGGEGGKIRRNNAWQG